MAFKFPGLLGKQSRQRIRDRTKEAERLYYLDDQELGEEVFSLARRARDDNPELLADPAGWTYSPNMVWHVMPEVARRLGAEIAFAKPPSIAFASRKARRSGTSSDNTSRTPACGTARGACLATMAGR